MMWMLRVLRMVSRWEPNSNLSTRPLSAAHFQAGRVFSFKIDMAFLMTVNHVLLINHLMSRVLYTNHFSEMLCLRSDLRPIATSKTLHFSLLNLISSYQSTNVLNCVLQSLIRNAMSNLPRLTWHFSRI